MPLVADLHVPIGTRVKLSLTDQGLKKLYKTIALLWEIPTEGLLQRAQGEIFDLSRFARLL